MKVIGYTRVSTEEQQDGGVSLDDQQRRIRLYCELHGHELIGIEVDGGFSGGSMDRPGIQAVMSALRKRKAEALVFTKLDRLTRRLRDLLDALDAARKGNYAIISMSESLDTSTSHGKFFTAMLGSLAELELDRIGERTKSALDHKRSRGEKLGGKVPYGFAVASDEVPDGKGGTKVLKRLVEAPAEQDVIDSIKAMRSSGLSLEQMAANLNAAGNTTRDGGPWKRQYVFRILKAVAK